jgi:hypothetical protein
MLEIADLLYEMSYTQSIKIQRTPVKDSTIAERFYRMTGIAMQLSAMLEGDVARVLKMLWLNHVLQARHMMAMPIFEVCSDEDLIRSIPGGDAEWSKVLAEYTQGKTIESKVAKDVSWLDLMIQERNGLNGPEEGEILNHCLSKLSLDCSRQVARSLMEGSPMMWRTKMYSVWGSKREEKSPVVESTVPSQKKKPINIDGFNVNHNIRYF